MYLYTEDEYGIPCIKTEKGYLYMNTSEKLIYGTIRMNAYEIIDFMHYQNFFDKELKKKLELLIKEINKYLENEQ